MKRAVMIKVYGDAEMGQAMAGAVAQRVIPLNTEEMEAVKAENKRLKAINGVRAIADDKRWTETQAKLARTYAVKRPGAICSALLVAWAVLWLEIVDWYRYFSTWNRS